MKKLFFVIILFLITVFLAGSSAKKTINFQSLIPIKQTTTPSTTIKNHTFHLYIAKAQPDREIGLTKYNSLQKDQGMYFIFETPNYYAFWMKGMKFPIDILFLNSGTVVDIKDSIPPADANDNNPPRYIPIQTADSVLEISAGLSKKYGISVGDKVTFSNLP